MNDNTCILYANDLFDSTDANSNKQQLQAIFDAGFTTVVLWAMHVQSNGDFHYNNTPMISNGQVSTGFNSQFGSLVSQLKSQTGSTVQKVLFSIGGSGVGDFGNIKTLLNNGQQSVLLNNFAALQKLAPALDGYDFDLEEQPYSDFSATIPQLTQLLHDNFSSMITYCPYEADSFWLDCLKAVAAQNQNQQIVNWMNLQVYGIGANPDQWASEVQNTPGTFVTDGNAFISAGYNAQGTSPASFSQNFNNLKVASGFVWNLGFIEQAQYTPAQYAQAILNGLAGT